MKDNIILVTPFGSTNIIFDGNLDQVIPSGPRCVIFTDEHILGIYKDLLFNREVLTIPRSEDCKDLNVVEKVVQKLIAMGIGRNDLLVAFGGGAICDFVGFVASVYRRGVSFGYIPTSLLAQVDAAIGGKNGVNVGSFKNMIGTFSSPNFVLINSNFTLTQERSDWIDGFAEIIKHGLVDDAVLFKYLVDNKDELLAQDKTLLAQCVRRAAEIKVNIVKRDPLDKAERMKLNFGHTVGHAIERELGISHGQAVSVGMVIEAQYSRKTRGLTESAIDSLKELLHGFGLPTTVELDLIQISAMLLGDKKIDGENISIPVLNNVGSAQIISVSNKLFLEELKSIID